MMGAGAQDERSSLVLAEWETRVEPAALLSRTVLCGQSRGLSEIQKQRNNSESAFYVQDEQLALPSIRVSGDG